MTILFFLLGLSVGSFLNVCICRIPIGESVVWERSHCPKCSQALSGWQLIPVLSYLIIRGKCSTCGEHISSQYPLVELLTGGMFIGLFYHYGLTWAVVPAIFLSSILIVVTIIDYKHMIIPNKVVLFGVLIGIPFNLALGKFTWVEILLGLTVGSTLLLLIALISKGGMGGGDVKFTAMLGIYLGWEYTLQTIFLASLLGAVVGISLMLVNRANRKTPIPFGPFLAVSALVMYLWGVELNAWYWSMFR